MKLYFLKFGETTADGSYSDDTTIAAESIQDAASKAVKISERRIRESKANFEFNKDSEDSRKAQKESWDASAEESYAITSIIFKGELEEP